MKKQTSFSFYLFLLIIVSSVLFADNINVNAVKIDTNIDNTSVYFYRKLIVIILAFVPSFIILIHSILKKSFTEFKSILIGFNLIFTYFLIRTIDKDIFSKFSSTIMFFCLIYAVVIFLLNFIMKFTIAKTALSIVLVITSVALLPNFKNDYNMRKLERACYSNLRVLQGAVEMYNMDTPEQMDNLEIEPLIKNGYLKNEPKCPEGVATYSGSNLTGDGIIMCGPEPLGSEYIIENYDYWGNIDKKKITNSSSLKYHGSYTGKVNN